MKTISSSKYTKVKGLKYTNNIYEYKFREEVVLKTQTFNIIIFII